MAQILWAVLCWWCRENMKSRWGDEKKEKSYLIVWQANTVWHYHLVDYKANLKYACIIGTWKRSLWAEDSFLPSSAEPNSYQKPVRPARTSDHKPGLVEEISASPVEISSVWSTTNRNPVSFTHLEIHQRGLFFLTCGWNGSLPDICSHRQCP